MKRAKFISLSLFKLLLLFSLVIPIKPVNSQTNSGLTWLNPLPQGNNINWVKRWDSQTIYALGDKATFMKTTDGGLTWYHKSGLYGSNNINSAQSFNDAYFIDKNTGWACGYQKVLKTTDAGITWDSVISGDDIWNNIQFINSNTGFISASFGGSITMTTDGGNTWSLMQNVPSGRYYCLYAVNEEKVIAVCNNGRIRKTTNGGINWTTINISPAIEYKSINFANENTGYICGNSGNVKYTTNFGDTWTTVGNGINNFSDLNDIDFFISPVLSGGPSNVYITGNDTGIYIAPIGIDNFTLVPIGNYSPGRDFVSTSVNSTGDTVVSAGEFGRIDVLEGSSHRSLTKTAKTWPLNDIWSDSTGNHIITVGYMDGSGTGDGAAIHNQILYSTNAGATWNTADFPDTIEQGLLCISMVNSLTGYVTGTSGIVSKTTNGGINWMNTSGTSTILDLYDIEFLNESTGYVFGYNGKGLKTTDGGNSWIDLNTNMGTSNIFGASFINVNTGWIVGNSGKVRKTTNGGDTFEIQNSGLGGIIFDVKMQDTNSGYLSGYEGNLKRTTDGGNTWFQVNTPYTLTNYSISFIDGLNGMSLSTEGYLFKTSTGGDTWEIIKTLSPQLSSVYMAASNTAYLCGSGGAIIRYGDVLTEVELTFSNTLPDDFFLEQNYPNPFNPSTTIRFGIPRQGLVSLKVYDMAGREVANLINNQQMNAGQITKSFDGSSLSSGVYFYSLIVDGKMIATKKMVLIK